MTQEESLKNQKIIGDLLDDIKKKANKIRQQEDEIKDLKSLLRQINKISSVRGVLESE